MIKYGKSKICFARQEEKLIDVKPDDEYISKVNYLTLPYNIQCEAKLGIHRKSKILKFELPKFLSCIKQGFPSKHFPDNQYPTLHRKFKNPRIHAHFEAVLPKI